MRAAADTTIAYAPRKCLARGAGSVPAKDGRARPARLPTPDGRFPPPNLETAWSATPERAFTATPPALEHPRRWLPTARPRAMFVGLKR